MQGRKESPSPSVPRFRGHSCHLVKTSLVENYYLSSSFKALTYLGDCQKCSLLIFRTMLSRLASTSLNAARGFSSSVARLILHVDTDAKFGRILSQTFP